MKLEIFYLCVRGENEFFIANTKNSLKKDFNMKNVDLIRFDFGHTFIK